MNFTHYEEIVDSEVSAFERLDQEERRRVEFIIERLESTDVGGGKLGSKDREGGGYKEPTVQEMLESGLQEGLEKEMRAIMEKHPYRLSAGTSLLSSPEWMKHPEVVSFFTDQILQNHVSSDVEEYFTNSLLI